MDKETRRAEGRDLPPIGGISKKEDAEIALQIGAPQGEAADGKKREKVRGENRPAE